MKKGFTLIDLMIVITIMSILAVVAVPTIFGMVCKSDLPSCKVDTPHRYKDVCLRSPKFCPISDVDSICWSAPNECMNESTNHGTWYLVQYYRQVKRAAEKAKKDAEAQTQPVVQQTVSNVDKEKLKQELLAEYEKKLDSITKINEVKTVETDIPVQGSKEEFIESCQEKSHALAW